MDITTYLSKIRRMDPDSHKGQNGKVMVIGGSELFHAASRWALDVVVAMVDMVFYSSVPENNALIHEAKQNFWSGVVVPRGEIEEYITEADVVLIGPGMTRTEYPNGEWIRQLAEENGELSEEEWNSDTYKITNYLLSKYPEKKWVVDAGALQMIDPSLLNKNCIITPHQGEYERIRSKFHNPNSRTQNETIVLLKGKEDKIFDPIREEVVFGGNAGMTKGGTGDVLAGLVAGLCAYTDDPFAAAVVASYVNKRAGDTLYETVGPFFTTNQLVEQIPKTLKQVLGY